MGDYRGISPLHLVHLAAASLPHIPTGVLPYCSSMGWFLSYSLWFGGSPGAEIHQWQNRSLLGKLVLWLHKVVSHTFTWIGWFESWSLNVWVSNSQSQNSCRSHSCTNSSSHHFTGSHSSLIDIRSSLKSMYGFMVNAYMWARSTISRVLEDCLVCHLLIFWVFFYASL